MYKSLKFFVFVLSFVTFLNSSCEKGVVFEQNKKIEKHNWNKNDTITFITNIADTSLVYDLFINIRNGGKYQYSNIFVFVDAIAPTGYQAKDIIEIALADNAGNWLGQGLGDLKFISGSYKNNVKFSTPGIYTFKMVQGMRTDVLKNIYDIGIKIQKHQAE